MRYCSNKPSKRESQQVGISASRVAYSLTSHSPYRALFSLLWHYRIFVFLFCLFLESNGTSASPSGPRPWSAIERAEHLLWLAYFITVGAIASRTYVGSDRIYPGNPSRSTTGEFFVALGFFWDTSEFASHLSLINIFVYSFQASKMINYRVEKYSVQRRPFLIVRGLCFESVWPM